MNGHMVLFRYAMTRPGELALRRRVHVTLKRNAVRIFAIAAALLMVVPFHA